MIVAVGLLAALLALTPGQQAVVVAVAHPHAPPAQPRAIALDVHGPADEANALRATLQELTARRGLAFTFEAPGERTQRTADPWATLSVELEAGANPGPAVTLCEGSAGRVRLHRVVPDGASHQVTIETLATIAYTALETLALEEAPRPAERTAAPPRARTSPTAMQQREDAHAERERPEPEAAPEPSKDGEVPALPPTAPITGTVSPPADVPGPARTDDDALTISSRAGALAANEPSFPVRFTLASFAGYQAGSLFTGDRRPAADAWGMGLAAAGAVPRWPLEPALALGLGAWYGIGRAPGAAGDGALRPTGDRRLQGQGEVRLTLLRYGRFSAALGPWLALSRVTYDAGPPAQMGPRGPAPGQPSPGPNAGGAFGPAIETHTELLAGGAARFEARLTERFAMYCAVAGAVPLTARPVPAGGRPASGSPSGGDLPPDAGTRWTLSTFAGLTIALTGGRGPF